MNPNLDDVVFALNSLTVLIDKETISKELAVKRLQDITKVLCDTQKEISDISLKLYNMIADHAVSINVPEIMEEEK